MKLKYKLLCIVAPLVFFADQAAKLVIETRLELGQRIPVIAGFLDIVHFRNTGGAFGIFAGLADSVRIPFFYLVALGALVFVLAIFRSLKENEKLLSVALSLVIGGMAGNILDRVRQGSVTDFLSVHIGDKVAQFELFGREFKFALEWPAFNVADSAITVAMFMVFYSVVFCKGKL